MKYMTHCSINEQTGDGVPVGRCWFFLPDGKTCPRHGDVTKAINYYERTLKCMLESDFKSEVQER